MEFIVTAREAIGPVRLGMSRQEVRAVMGVPAQTFRRNEFSNSDSDHFEESGIVVDYDVDDKCNFITAAAEARPTFEGRPIVGVPYHECERWLRGLDQAVEAGGTGLISKKLGISLYAGSAGKDPSAPVEAVSVFAQGYYD